MGTMVSAPQEVLAYRKSLRKGFEIFCMVSIVILLSILRLFGLFAYFGSSNWILIYVLCQIGATGLGVLIAGIAAHCDFKVIRYNEMEGNEAILYDPESQSLLLKDPFLGEDSVPLSDLYKVKGSSDVIYTGKVLVMVFPFYGIYPPNNYRNKNERGVVQYPKSQLVRQFGQKQVKIVSIV